MAKPVANLLAALALGIAGQVAPARAQSPAAPATAPGPNASTTQSVDPELLRPLTPLDAFNVEAQQATAAAAPAKPTTISYAVQIVGLKMLGLERRFRALSSLEQKRGKAENTAQIRARANDDVKLIGQILRSNGYYDGQADVLIRPDTKRKGRVIVTLTATPGPLYRLGTVAVTGPATSPPGLPREALPLKTGEPIVAPTVEGAEANVSLRLPEQGYPFVKVGQRDVLLDDTTHTGDYTLPVAPGSRSSFGRIELAGTPVLRLPHVEVISRFKTGELYDSRKADDLRRALVATSLYSSVGIAPVDTGKTAADGTEVVDVQVTGSPAPPRTLSGSLGYDTGLGARVEAEWTNHNLFPPEGALTLHAIAGSQESLLGVTFLRSNAGQRDRSLQALAQISNENLDAYNANTITIGATLSRASTPIWQKRWTYSTGAQVLVSQESGYDLALGATTRETYKIIALPLQGEYDRSDSLLNPTRGFRLTFSPTPEVSFESGTKPYFKAILEGDGYIPVRSNIVLAGRLRFGGLVGPDAYDIAPSRRFYSGGGGSVRGYGYQELGPKDPSNDPIGGSSLTEFSTEVRYRVGDIGLVTFLDGGQVYESSTPRFSDIRLGTGVGARYYTNFGPIRFDIGTPIDRQAGESVVSVYISIGQAF